MSCNSTQKKLDIEVSTVFLVRQGSLVVLDVTYNRCKAFGLVAIYPYSVTGQSDFFRSLNNFLRTLNTLVLLSNFNTICGARIDCVSTNTNKRGNPCLNDQLNCFQRTNRFRLDHPDISLWKWANNDRLSRSYLDKIIVRSKERSCLQHHIFSTTVITKL